MNKFFKHLGLWLLLVVNLSACGSNLHSTSLSIGVLNQQYSDSFFVEDDAWSWNDGVVLTLTGGSLPPGLFLSSNGTLAGTPEQVGEFDFRVTAYTFDNSYFGEDDVYEDSETFTMFITEASTNDLCPSPNDEATTETFICLGNVSLENLEADEEFELDVNYFVDFDKGGDYDIKSVEFSVFYDPNVVIPISEMLNSQILREAATRAEATVTFTEPQDGELHVVVNANDNSFNKAGRFMDLPFAAVANVPAGEYAFTVTIDDIASESDDTLNAGLSEIDGALTITTGEYADAETDVDVEADVVDETVDLEATETDESADPTSEDTVTTEI